MADSPTNPSAADAISAAKQANSEVVGAPPSITVDSLIAGSPTLSGIKNNIENLGNLGRSAMAFLGGKKPDEKPAGVTVGNSSAKDLRVRIKVPSDYLYPLTVGTTSNLELFNAHGIIFPYTPQISVDYKADYASAPLTHSNFAVYFYKSSAVAPISISGKFTVQNQADAEVYLATVHLLRALTKMRFGKDTDPGAPPPVCQLNAYGDYMLDNVPVVISSFKNDLPDNVDYFGVNSEIYGETLVPIVSTIIVNCIPMYSRKEMLESSVTGWLSGSNGRKAGYL